jgi:hypothetical protein
MIIMFAVEQGEYVVSCDVDAMGGVGAVVFGSREQAMRFEDAACALAYWKLQSRVQPFRLDGKPNRPLSALTVELQLVEE